MQTLLFISEFCYLVQKSSRVLRIKIWKSTYTVNEDIMSYVTVQTFKILKCMYNISAINCNLKLKYN